MRVWCSGFNRKGKGETLKKEARGSRVFHERVGFTVGSRVNWDRDLKTSQRVSGFRERWMMRFRVQKLSQCGSLQAGSEAP